MENRKLKPPKRIHRTTFDIISRGLFPNVMGVYIIAYLGKILYIGKTERSIPERFRQHFHNKSRIGNWLMSMSFDWDNVRVDVLEPEAFYETDWLSLAEEACITKFNPLFNQRLKHEVLYLQDCYKQHYQKHSSLSASVDVTQP